MTTTTTTEFEFEPGSDAERERFHQLQDRLAEQFRRFSADPTQPYTAVVVPSLSFDADELAKIEGVAHYEERNLFNLMLLRHPRLRVVYVTSKRLNPLVVDYFLHHLRGVPGMHARRRLTLLDCDDASSRPLTEKILERPLLTDRIREAIADPSMAHLSVMAGSPLERSLSVRLGIPLNACDPDLAPLGSKSGSRRLFRAAGIDLPAGREDLRGLDALVHGLATIWEEAPQAKRLVLKLERSFSGEGNAVLDLQGAADVAPGSGASTDDRRTAIRRLLPSSRCVAAGLSFEQWLGKFEDMGGICEEWVEGVAITSPSMQGRITPAREAQVVSTHDQILDEQGQVFLGGRFPADDRYRLDVQERGRRVGEHLAAAGAIGRYGVDFVYAPQPEGPPRIVALEINLRGGGTTHPFNTLKFLTDGSYREETGTFHTRFGDERTYVSTDTLTSPDYRGVLPYDLIDALVVEGVHFRTDETGVVFHLLGCLSEYGKVGCVAIGRDMAQAESLLQQTRDLLARISRRPGPR